MGLAARWITGARAAKSGAPGPTGAAPPGFRGLPEPASPRLRPIAAGGGGGDNI
jgi:hypothetical protein